MNTCPVCSHSLSPLAVFCPQCGHKLPRGATVFVQPKPTEKLSSQARLEIQFPGQPSYALPLSANKVTIGREKDNQIITPFADVSRHHASVYFEDGQYKLIDYESTNGTLLQGILIPSQQAMSLSPGDLIRVGDELGNSVSITYLEGEKPIPSIGTIKIGELELVRLHKFSIGRDPSSHIPINSPIVSWHHAEVMQLGQGHQIKDLKSTNGTFVNGRRITTQILNEEDEVQIGPMKFIYSSTAFHQFSAIGSVRLDGLRLWKQVKTKQGYKVLINDISITIMPREFIALVGGSGAGKSTLMDALNGFRHAHKGRVLFNGDDLYQHYAMYQASLGYVPQMDILHTNLTVRQALRYTGMLRLPQDTNQSSLRERVQDALQNVDMLVQIDQPISSLSGGQRKRVSIAAELLSDPSLFFLDEPTSGLDPGLDKKMMYTLRRLADQGKTIILTTHATNNIIGQCNQVAFLSQGSLVYYAPPEQANEYFGVSDFADIYTEIDKGSTAKEKRQTAEQWHKKFIESSLYQKYVVERQEEVGRALKDVDGSRAGLRPSNLGFMGTLRQFSILTQRYINLILNDLSSFIVLLLVMPLIGFLLGLITNAKALVGDAPEVIERIIRERGFYSMVMDGQNLILMMSLAVGLLGVFGAAYELIKERAVFNRERMVNLRLVPYLASKVVVLMGLGVVQTAALLWVVSLKVEMPKEGVFLPGWLEVYLTLWLLLLVGVTAGLWVSALVKSSNTIIYLILMVLFMQIFFSGALFDLPEVVKPLSAVTPTRWAMEAIGSTVNIERLNDMGKMYIFPVKQTLDWQYSLYINYESSLAHLLKGWGILVLFCAAFCSLCAFSLKLQE